MQRKLLQLKRTCYVNGNLNEIGMQGNRRSREVTPQWTGSFGVLVAVRVIYCFIKSRHIFSTPHKCPNYHKFTLVAMNKMLSFIAETIETVLDTPQRRSG